MHLRHHYTATTKTTESITYYPHSHHHQHKHHYHFYCLSLVGFPQKTFQSIIWLHSVIYCRDRSRLFRYPGRFLFPNGDTQCTRQDGRLWLGQSRYESICVFAVHNNIWRSTYLFWQRRFWRQEGMKITNERTGMIQCYRLSQNDLLGGWRTAEEFVWNLFGLEVLLGRRQRQGPEWFIFTLMYRIVYFHANVLPYSEDEVSVWSLITEAGTDRCRPPGQTKSSVGNRQWLVWIP